MSFLAKLFGKKVEDGPQAPAQATGQLDYKGFVIRAVPFKQNGQFQTAGLIEKTIDGQTKSYRFVRADRSGMVEEVTELALLKGRMIIDEQGERIFD